MTNSAEKVIIFPHLLPRENVPQRIQRQRSRGWRTPDCGCGCGGKAIYVGRGTHWGNQWKVGEELYGEMVDHDPRYCCYLTITPELAVALYAAQFAGVPSASQGGSWVELAGHDLMCWCPLIDEHGDRYPCHADVLLDLANRKAPSLDDD